MILENSKRQEFSLPDLVHLPRRRRGTGCWVIEGTALFELTIIPANKPIATLSVLSSQTKYRPREGVFESRPRHKNVVTEALLDPDEAPSENETNTDQDLVAFALQALDRQLKSGAIMLDRSSRLNLRDVVLGITDLLETGVSMANLSEILTRICDFAAMKLHGLALRFGWYLPFLAATPARLRRIRRSLAANPNRIPIDPAAIIGWPDRTRDFDPFIASPILTDPKKLEWKLQDSGSRWTAEDEIGNLYMLHLLKLPGGWVKARFFGQRLSYNNFTDKLDLLEEPGEFILGVALNQTMPEAPEERLQAVFDQIARLSGPRETATRRGTPEEMENLISALSHLSELGKIEIRLEPREKGPPKIRSIAGFSANGEKFLDSILEWFEPSGSEPRLDTANVLERGTTVLSCGGELTGHSAIEAASLIDAFLDAHEKRIGADQVLRIRKVLKIG